MASARDMHSPLHLRHLASGAANRVASGPGLRAVVGGQNRSDRDPCTTVGTYIGLKLEAINPDPEDSVSYTVGDDRFSVGTDGLVRVARAGEFDFRSGDPAAGRGAFE